MDVLVFLIPIALFMGFAGLVAFIWALRNGQYEDLDGEAQRILFEDDPRKTARSAPNPPESQG